MKELVRFINVSSTSAKHNLQYLNFFICSGELVSFSCNTISEKDALVSLFTRNLSPTTGKILWNTKKANAGCFITPSTRMLFETLPIYESFVITANTPFRFLYSKRKSIRYISDLMVKYGIDWDASLKISALNQSQKYILSVLKAAYLGFPLIILSGITSLHYGCEINVLKTLIKALLIEGYSFIVTEPEDNPLLTAFSYVRTFYFENDMLVRVRDHYTQPVSRITPAILPVSSKPSDHNSFNSNTELVIPLLYSGDEYHFVLRPGEITYFIEKGLYDPKLFHRTVSSPKFILINNGKKLYHPTIRQLLKNHIGYFPRKIESLIFPNLDVKANTTLLVLDKISYWRTLINKKFESFFLSTQVYPETGKNNMPLYNLPFEKKLEVLVNRFLLQHWNGIIIHLPSLPKEGKGAEIMRKFIQQLAENGCAVLVIVAASSEIITDYHYIVSLDS